jgi:hypothetical protein
LRAKAQHFGINLEAAKQEGAVELLMVPPHDLDADLVAWLIRERIEAGHVERLVIDSAAELQGGLTSPERGAMFMASLYGAAWLVATARHCRPDWPVAALAPCRRGIDR